jgi:hypothetical protein
MPGGLGELAVNTRVHTYYPMRTRGCGCAWHPAFPTPSGYGAENFWHDSGALRRENAKLHLAVIARSGSDEAIHSFFVAARWIASLALAMTVLIACAHIFGRRHPRKRVIQYSRGNYDEPRSGGVLDTPLSRSMMRCGGRGLRRDDKGKHVATPLPGSIPPPRATACRGARRERSRDVRFCWRRHRRA